MKGDLSTLVTESLAPITARYHELRADTKKLNEIIELGSEKASAIAKVTYERAATAMGLI